jgi:hypothetical protein
MVSLTNGHPGLIFGNLWALLPDGLWLQSICGIEGELRSQP